MRLAIARSADWGVWSVTHLGFLNNLGNAAQLYYASVTRLSPPPRESGSRDYPLVQTGDIYSRGVRCENNDRLGLMHTSDHRRSVWYVNQRHQSARSLTRETEEDDENSRFVYERFLVWTDESTYEPINHSYG